MTEGPIRVLIVDDSLVAREMLAQILSSDDGIEVIGMARDGEEAVAAVGRLHPDLVTMDIHMPRMNGLEAVERIMAYNPTPILVVSSSVHGEGMGSAFDALACGALEVIKKPEPKDWADLQDIGRDVIRKVRLLAGVHVITHISGRHGARSSHAAASRHSAAIAKRSLLAIGSSTGGPSALLGVLGRLPEDFPVPIVVAQHIAEGFIPGLVSWLDSGSEISVCAAQEGQQIEPGVAYFAPTGSNLEVDGTVLRFSKPLQGQLYIPSADTLFSSVSSTYGAHAVGVILTGMGADGAKGLKAMRDSGAVTIAQDESTSTVFGMPRAAAEMGAASKVLPVTAIAGELVTLMCD